MLLAIAKSCIALCLINSHTFGIHNILLSTGLIACSHIVVPSNSSIAFNISMDDCGEYFITLSTIFVLYTAFCVILHITKSYASLSLREFKISIVFLSLRKSIAILLDVSQLAMLWRINYTIK